jgi:cytosine/adenosine deaminase-related metal-dependent hydrolase
MATIDGARALGLEAEIGSLEVGKRADVAVVGLSQLHTSPEADVVSSLVYAAEAGDVRSVVIDGRVVMQERELLTIDEAGTVAEANVQAELLLARASGVKD